MYFTSELDNGLLLQLLDPPQYCMPVTNNSQIKIVFCLAVDNVDICSSVDRFSKFYLACERDIKLLSND